MAHPDLPQILDGPNLPTLPAVVARVLEAIEADEIALDELGEMLAQDAALTTALLRAANSSLYAPATPLASVAHAVGFLGRRAVRDLVLMTSVVRAFPGDHPGLDASALWEHSACTAVAAATLAGPLAGEVAAAMDEAPYFLSGLLHDIGVLLLSERLGKRYAHVLEAARESGAPLHEAERSAFGFDHAEAGAALLERWGLPWQAVVGARWHHAPESAPTAGSRIARTVTLANQVAHLLETTSADADSEEPDESGCEAPSVLAAEIKGPLAAIGVEWIQLRDSRDRGRSLLSFVR